jgi:hypothetical protein
MSLGNHLEINPRAFCRWLQVLAISLVASTTRDSRHAAGCLPHCHHSISQETMPRESTRPAKRWQLRDAGGHGRGCPARWIATISTRCK